MIFYTSTEILISIALFIFFGALCGILYPSLSLIFKWFSKMLSTEIQILKSKHLIAHFAALSSSRNTDNGIAKNVYDFIFFLTCGASCCIFCYVCADGVFRIYTLLLAIVAFFAAKSSIGAFFKYIIYLFLNLIYRAWFSLLSIINVPIKALIKLIRIPAHHIFTKITDSARSYHKRTVVKKKIKQITYVFKDVA